MRKAHVLSGKPNNKSSEKPMIDLDNFNSNHFNKREIEIYVVHMEYCTKQATQSKLSQ